MSKQLPPVIEQGLDQIEQEINEYVGFRLRQGRAKLGMKQMELAEYLGVSFQQLQKYETGRNRLGPAKMFRFSQLLGVTPNYFFDGLDDGQPRKTPSRRQRRMVERLLAAPLEVQQALHALLKAIEPDE